MLRQMLSCRYHGHSLLTSWLHNECPHGHWKSCFCTYPYPEVLKTTRGRFQLISGKFHGFVSLSEDLISWAVGLEPDKATSHAFSPAVSALGIQNAPKRTEEIGMKSKMHACMHLKTWHVFVFF